ncbi:hypothetical protein QE152_g33305 [Popillia japonica]|uniref:Uncharacterized protein n=2 Tax=Popillia japonica TaxID=7064 RepID=A0AAW1IWS7_POPJA
MSLCERAKTRITLEPTEDAGLIETNDAPYGVLKIQNNMSLCERAKTRITLEPTEDAGLIETNDAPYGVLKIQNSPPTSFANPVYEPTAPAPTYKVEDVVIRGRSSISTSGGLSGVKSWYH